MTVATATNGIPPYAPDDTDRRLIAATQGGLPLCSRPFHRIAKELDMDPGDVMYRMQCMMDNGVIRRIAAVPNHYRLGFRANGMSVWDVADGRISELGQRVGDLAYVSHCYHRPRRPPVWPYNLFAMVHGRTREEVLVSVEGIAALLGDASRSHDVLFSTEILKKTGMRLSRAGNAP